MHRRVPGARVVAVAAVVALVAAGAAYAAGAFTTAKVTKVGIATPAKASDYGWNAQGYNGAKAAAKANGATFTAITNIGYDKTDVVLRQLDQGRSELHRRPCERLRHVAARLARQYKVPMITYDVPSNLAKGYVSYVTTSSQEGAYLAGILAARTTKTHKVGIIISAADDNWYKMSGGFAAGFRSVDKTSKIYFATVSPTGYDDAAGGKRVANSVIAQGADVLFTMGDNASFGYLQAIESAKVGHKVWMIGDIGDMTPIDKNHVFLSSVLWNFTGTFNQAIKDVEQRHLRHPRLRPQPEERRHLAAALEVHRGRRLGADQAAAGADHGGQDQDPRRAQGRRRPEADEVGTATAARPRRSDRRGRARSCRAHWTDNGECEQRHADRRAGGDHQGVPGGARERPRRPDAPARRGPLPAGRERRRQVDADRDPLRPEPARTRERSGSRESRRRSRRRGRRSSSESARCTSTRR